MEVRVDERRAEQLALRRRCTSAPSGAGSAGPMAAMRPSSTSTSLAGAAVGQRGVADQQHGFLGGLPQRGLSIMPPPVSAGRWRQQHEDLVGARTGRRADSGVRRRPRDRLCAVQGAGAHGPAHRHRRLQRRHSQRRRRAANAASTCSAPAAASTATAPTAPAAPSSTTAACASRAPNISPGPGNVVATLHAGRLGAHAAPRRQARRPAADDHAQRGLQPPDRRRPGRAGGLRAAAAAGSRRRRRAGAAAALRVLYGLGQDPRRGVDHRPPAQAGRSRWPRA